MLEKMFKLKENNTTAKTEVIAGITTFMTMAYILAVNPNLLSQAGMDPTAVLIATCLASFIGTFAMALLANYPFALAPGMGLNAYFAFTVCGNMGYSWKVALMAVFFEGIIFIILSLTNVREAIFNAIPTTLKKGVSAGIGLFIAWGAVLVIIAVVFTVRWGMARHAADSHSSSAKPLGEDQVTEKPESTHRVVNSTPQKEKQGDDEPTATTGLGVRIP